MMATGQGSGPSSQACRKFFKPWLRLTRSNAYLHVHTEDFLSPSSLGPEEKERGRKRGHWPAPLSPTLSGGKGRELCLAAHGSAGSPLSYQDRDSTSFLISGLGGAAASGSWRAWPWRGAQGFLFYGAN